MSLADQQQQEKQAVYTLIISANFCSAHSLRAYPGDCRRLHGHNWRVETEVKAYRLDAIGIAIDFKTLKTQPGAWGSATIRAIDSHIEGV